MVKGEKIRGEVDKDEKNEKEKKLEKWGNEGKERKMNICTKNGRNDRAGTK